MGKGEWERNRECALARMMDALYFFVGRVGWGWSVGGSDGVVIEMLRFSVFSFLANAWRHRRSGLKSWWRHNAADRRRCYSDLHLSHS